MIRIFLFKLLYTLKTYNLYCYLFPPELHPMGSFASDGAFHFIGSKYGDLGNLRTGFR